MCANNQLVESVVRLATAQDKLDSASLIAFMQLDRQFTSISAALLDWIGARQKAAGWMMVN